MCIQATSIGSLEQVFRNFSNDGFREALKDTTLVADQAATTPKYTESKKCYIFEICLNIMFTALRWLVKRESHTEFIAAIKIAQKNSSTCARPSTTPTSIKQNPFLTPESRFRSSQVMIKNAPHVMSLLSFLARSATTASWHQGTSVQGRDDLFLQPLLPQISGTNYQIETWQTTKLWLYCRWGAAHAQPPC